MLQKLIQEKEGILYSYSFKGVFGIFGSTALFDPSDKSSAKFIGYIPGTDEIAQCDSLRTIYDFIRLNIRAYGDDPKLMEPWPTRYKFK